MVLIMIPSSEISIVLIFLHSAINSKLDYIHHFIHMFVFYFCFLICTYLGLIYVSFLWSYPDSHLCKIRISPIESVTQSERCICDK